MSLSSLLVPETKEEDWSKLYARSLSVIDLTLEHIHIDGDAPLVVDDLTVDGDFNVLAGQANIGPNNFQVNNGTGTSGQVLTTDGAGVLSWATNGSGNVSGPVSSINNRLVAFNGTTGKIIKDSGIFPGNFIVNPLNANINCGGFYIQNCGNLTMSGDIDTTTFAPANLYPTASAVNISAPGVVTTARGALTVGEKLRVNNSTNYYDLPTNRGSSGDVLTSNGSFSPAWQAVNRMALQFGADLSSPNYAVFGGAADATAVGLGVSTTAISPVSGNVVAISWNTTSGDATTAMTCLVDGSSEPFTLSAATGYQSIGPFSVSPGVNLGIRYASGTAPGISNFILYIQ